MAAKKIGYGMGTKDFTAPQRNLPVANCLRVFWEEKEENTAPVVAELSCNLDDMTGEAISYACERLLEAGALDVFTQSIQMKKGRPGVLLTCLCPPGDAERFAGLLLMHTTTLGVREAPRKRYTLERELREEDTLYGNLRLKISRGFGVTKTKFEYEDLAQAARASGKPLWQVERDLQNDRAAKGDS